LYGYSDLKKHSKKLCFISFKSQAEVTKGKTHSIRSILRGRTGLEAFFEDDSSFFQVRKFCLISENQGILNILENTGIDEK
jgi:hypothetical protein